MDAAADRLKTSFVGAIFPFAAAVLVALALSGQSANAAGKARKDITAPTAPTNLVVKSAGLTSVVLGWSPSKDNIKVVSYAVYLGTSSKPKLNVSTTLARLRGLTCGTAYTVTVVAKDKAGNRSRGAVATVSTQPCPDTEAPSAPTSVRQDVTTETSVMVSWAPSVDNTGVVGYGIYAGGLRIVSVAESNATLSDLPCGSTLGYGIDAVDAAGNRSPVVDFVIQTSSCPGPPPPPSGGGGGGSDSVAPSTPGIPSVTAATTSSVTITWVGSTDNIAVSGYGIYKNGQLSATATGLSSVVGGLNCGTTYTLGVDAFDAAGNRSSRSQTQAATSACTDGQPPSPPIDVNTLSRTSTSIALYWSPAIDNVGVTGYGAYRGGGKVGDTSGTTFIFSGLECGRNHTLGIDAVDGAGNRSSQALVMVATTACPDQTPPSAPAGLSATNVAQTSLTLNWSASTDDTGVAGYKVYRNGVEVASVASTTTSQSGLVCGTSYTFAIGAFDAALNMSSNSTVVASTSACSPPPGPVYPASYFTGPLGSKNFVPQTEGAFLIDYPGVVGYTWAQQQAMIVQREQDIGRKFDGIHFQYWGGGSYSGQSNCIDIGTINERREQWIHDRGEMPIVSWSPARTIAEVNSGAVDACFAVAANHFKQYGFPIMLRLWWEFDNTAGFPWAVGKTSNIGQPFITAWQRVVNIFKQQGATNVGFWWTPLEGSPDRAGINASYPGDAYVDWVGSDVYNGCYVVEPSCWSTPLHSGWATFADAAAYNVTDLPSQYALWSSRKPFVYGEVGVGYDPSGSPSLKGDWYRAVPGVLKAKLPRVAGLSFFDQDVTALEGSRNNWRVDYPSSNADVYAGFKQMAADPWLNTRR